jgi:hypothetical protein
MPDRVAHPARIRVGFERTPVHEDLPVREIGLNTTISPGVWIILVIAKFWSGPFANKYPGPSGRHDACMLSLPKFSLRVRTTASTDAGSMGL